MKKRILSLFLALGLSVSLLTTGALAADDGLSNFKSVNTYTTGTFTDVPADTWYTSNVKTAYELDLMKGTSGTSFSPDGNITVGSTIALACRLHSIYNTGAANFVQGDPWYQVYVDYAVKNGIISQGQFTDYNAVATRRQFAAILARALPAEALEAMSYLLAGEEMPPQERYDGYLQLENGVGMMRLLENEFQEAFDGLPGDDLSREVSVATGKLAYPLICSMAEKLKSRYPGTVIHTYQIENRYFGERITVAGLITGQDLKEQLAGKDLGKALLLPCNMFRSQEEVFLDDVTLTELKDALQSEIDIVKSSGQDFIDAVLKLR